MRRVIAIALAGASLGGCSSFSWDSLKPAPTPIPVQFESVPSGADAVTSLGPGCTTPCSLSVTPPEGGFTVTFTLPKFQTATVPVQVIHNPGDFMTASSTVINPNPVIAELQPAAPPPKPRRPKPKKPKPAPAAAAPAAPAPVTESPFPDPSLPPPPPR